MAKASKKSDASTVKSVIKFQIDPTECPFREYRDNELNTEFWGLGPAAFRANQAAGTVKGTSKPSPSTSSTHTWSDEQTQPLPRSVRHYLHGWVRAEELAMSRWEAEVVIFEDNNGSKMSVIDMQLSHAQVLLRSSFCRQVLCVCFMLERAEGVSIEHQWENFTFMLGPEGWRAKNHIYCPGMKPGGGVQHRPGLSKNGCYLVRLYYLGAWRCVWVNDQVPVDANDSPLLPFSPLLSHPPTKSLKQIPTTVTASVVHLWPLLICKENELPARGDKMADHRWSLPRAHTSTRDNVTSGYGFLVIEALLKLAAPDMNSDEETDNIEDELMPELDILHALTGAMSIFCYTAECLDPEPLWKLLISEVPVFYWDDDDDGTSTVKSKSTKKPTNKQETVTKKTIVTVQIEDSKNLPPYSLPGITPAHEMSLLVSMVRDLPLKKPLPEPDVAPWKNYRWVDWARRHGLYEAYDCPRTKFLKVNGLLKLSYAPHLLDVQSTESGTEQRRRSSGISY